MCVLFSKEFSSLVWSKYFVEREGMDRRFTAFDGGSEGELLAFSFMDGSFAGGFVLLRDLGVRWKMLFRFFFFFLGNRFLVVCVLLSFLIFSFRVIEVNSIV